MSALFRGSLPVPTAQLCSCMRFRPPLKYPRETRSRSELTTLRSVDFARCFTARPWILAVDSSSASSDVLSLTATPRPDPGHSISVSVASAGRRVRAAFSSTCQAPTSPSACLPRVLLTGCGQFRLPGTDPKDPLATDRRSDRLISQSSSPFALDPFQSPVYKSASKAVDSCAAAVDALTSTPGFCLCLSAASSRHQPKKTHQS